MTSEVTDAQLALLEWLDLHITSIHQAFEQMAESNRNTAERFIREDDGQVGAMARMLKQSADGWDARSTSLAELYRALPEDE